MIDTDHPTQAVIYARVSSAKQVSEGSGLTSQTTRCREYARHKGLEVVKTFTDDMTGRVIGRPGMNDMLTFLRKHRRTRHVVIIDDISRLARDIDAHRALRKSIRKAGGVLQSPSITFGESSDDELIENMLASVAQHQRQKNSEQVVNRMRARLLAGYAVFQAPPGYRYERRRGHGKILVRDEPSATVLQEALEGFASGRFQTQAEVARFLEAHPSFPSKGRPIAQTKVKDHLERVLYAGYIEAPNWNVSRRKGHHEPLISYETYLKIQTRLDGTAYAPARANLGEDFALRGFVECADCGTPLRSCFSKGHSRRYPYYLCQNKGCASYGKSIPRDRLEGDFEALLQALRPHPGLLKLAKAMFADIWAGRMSALKDVTTSLEREMTRCERQIAQLVDRVMETESPTLISTYETKIKALEHEKLALCEKHMAAKQPKSPGHFERQYRTALEYLSNPCKLWASERLIDRRAVLKLTFCGRLAYHRKSGFRTAFTDKLSLPFRVLADMTDPKNQMVGPAGLEPATKPL